MSAPLQSMLNSIGVILLGAVLSFLAAAYWFRRQATVRRRRETEAALQRQEARLVELESKLALVTQSIVPINLAFQAILVNQLTHYHTPEMDALLKKIGPPNALTETEAARLADLLVQRTQDMAAEISESERDAALILPAVMRRARQESETLKVAEQLKMGLVSVATVIGIPVVLHERPMPITGEGAQEP